MPVVVEGLANTRRAMKKFTPDVYEKMNSEIKSAMIVVRNDARAYVPFNVMSNWEKQTGIWSTRGFNSQAVKRGIVYRMGQTKANDKGFRSAYSVINKTPAGQIFEWAGRVNQDGQPWTGPKGKGGKRSSHSTNPTAGATFIQNIQDQRSLAGGGKQKGRLVYKAWAEDNNKVLPAAVKAINEAIVEFNLRAKP